MLPTYIKARGNHHSGTAGPRREDGDAKLRRARASAHTRATPSKRLLNDFVVPMVGILGTAVILTLLFVLRAPTGPEVVPPNQDECTCSCWDGLSEGLTGRVMNEVDGRYSGSLGRGVGEPPNSADITAAPPTSQYHSVFFNLDGGSFRILLLTLFYAYLAQHAWERLASLVIAGQARLPMVVNLVSSLYPNFACWWMLVAHWNSPTKAAKPIGRQVVYSVTEMIAAVTNYRMLDLRRPPNRPGLIMMAVVGSAHTVQSLADEALVNIFTLRGAWTADLLFLAGDVCTTTVACVYLHKHYGFFHSWQRAAACLGAVLMLLIVFHIPSSEAASEAAQKGNAPGASAL